MTLPTLDQWKYAAGTLRSHARRRWWLYVLAGAGFAYSMNHYRIALNMSDSLPESMYLVVLDSKPTAVGDFVAFEWQRNMFYRRDWTFVKRVAGVAGQKVTLQGRQVFIDGKPVGYAKPRSLRGEPLSPIKEGVIPEGYVYAQAPHPDSLDSRYEVTGLIQTARVVGKAYAIF